ncbi:hypothetical protein BB561_003873 [Smittium simulii]|uniref:DEK C-terminal domain-containing protein n=1 Tax=Smittium simulii TaxID=133385 RepID=A0A2T9YJ65_9FUNG|nr:hypothetical protein BB561_003873 [Smittium simulii]
MPNELKQIDFASVEKACHEILRVVELEKMTMKMILRQTEQKLELETGSLSLPQNKPKFKQIVERALENIDSIKCDTQNDEDSSSQVSTNTLQKNSSEVFIHRTANSTQTTSESEISSDFDTRQSKNLKHKKSKTKQSPSTIDSKKSKNSSEKNESKKSKNTKASDSKDSVAITNLKKYVNKCGVRKVWAKEFKDTTKKYQLDYLKNLLESLGVQGRPTLAKCAQIKAKRELQTELDDLNVENIIEDASNIDSTPRPTVKRLKRYNQNEQHSPKSSSLSDNKESDESDLSSHPSVNSTPRSKSATRLESSSDLESDHKELFKVQDNINTEIKDIEKDESTDFTKQSLADSPDKTATKSDNMPLNSDTPENLEMTKNQLVATKSDDMPLNSDTPENLEMTKNQLVATKNEDNKELLIPETNKIKQDVEPDAPADTKNTPKDYRKHRKVILDSDSE